MRTRSQPRYGPFLRPGRALYLAALLAVTASCGGGGGGVAAVLGPYLQAPALHANFGIDRGDRCAGVLLHSGELVLQRVDMALRGRSLGFALVRTYRSIFGGGGPLGPGWTCNWFARLEELPGGDVVHHMGDGRSYTYTSLGAGAFAPPAGFFTALKKETTGFRLRNRHGLVHHFALDGRLTRIRNRLGDHIDLGYAGALPTSVMDDLGRVVVLAYDASNRLETVTDFTGREVRYSYDGEGRLVTARSPLVVGTPTGNDFPNGRTERYRYFGGAPDADLRDNLLGVEAPQEFATAPGTEMLLVNYGVSGPPRDRVISLTRGGTNATGTPAGGTFAYTYDFAPSGGPPGTTARTTVTDRRGGVTRYDHDATGHMLRAVESPSGAAFTTRCEYDAHGNVVRIVQPEGNEAQFLYDAANPDRFQQGNLLEVKRLPDAARGGDQVQIVTTYTYDPIYNLRRTVTTPRGNDPAYVPQNGGAPSAARYTATTFFDWQEAAAPPADAADWSLTVPPGLLGLGDLNGDGLTNQSFGQPVRLLLPAVQLLAGGKQAAEEGGPQQARPIVRVYNRFGQLIREEDARGNVDTFAYHPEQDPDGDGANPTPNRDPATGGFLATSTRDALIGPNRQDPGPATMLATSFLYDARGNLVQRTDPRGFVWTTTFNTLDEPIVVETPKVHVSQPDGYVRLFLYDANGRLVEQSVENESTDPGTLLPTPGAGPAAWVTTYAYDILGRLIRTTSDATRDPSVPPTAQPGTLTTEYDYDANGNRVVTRTPRATSGAAPEDRVLVTYDERDLVQGVTRGGASPDASTVTFDYDANRNVVRVTDADGGDTTRYEYDGYDRRVRTIDRMGNETTQTFSPEGRPIRAEVRGPATTGGANVLLGGSDYLWDEGGRLFGLDRDLFLPVPATSGATVAEGPLVPADGKVNTRLEYDANGRLTFRIEDDQACYRCVYDGADRRIQVVLPIVDPAGPTPTNTTYTYDANDNVVRSDATHANPDSLAPPQVVTTRHVYDALNRRVRTTDAQGETTYTSYDSRDNVVAVHDARGPAIADPLGLFAGMINAPGNVTRFFYDGVCRCWLTRCELRLGGQGANVIDTSNPDNSDGLIDILRVYDPNGNVVRVEDDLSNATTYVYDALGRRVQRTNADGNNDNWVFDGDHRITSWTDAAGTVHTFGYDALDRLLSHAVAPAPGLTVAGGAFPLYVGSTVQTFEYDGLSRLIRATDNNEPSTASDDAETVRRYDSLSRLVEELQDGAAVGTSHVADHPSALHYPTTGRVVTRTYDEHDQLVELADVGVFQIAFSHQGTAAHAPLRVDRSTPAGLGSRTSTTLDEELWPTQMAHANGMAQGTGGSFNVLRTRTDRLLAHHRQHAVPAGGSYTDQLSFGVDSAGRLTDEDLAQAGVANFVRQIDLRLDGAGALTRVDIASGPGAPTNTDFRTALRSPMHEITDVPFQHDGDGGGGLGLRTQDPQRILQWDAFGRVRCIRQAGSPTTVVAKYDYDACPVVPGGRRIRKTVTNSGPLNGTTRLLYAGTAVLEEQDAATGKTRREYVYGRGPADLLAMDVDTNADGSPDLLSFFHQDVSGNVVQLVAGDGTPREFYTIPWLDLPISVHGQTLVPQGPSAHGNPYIVRGLRFEPEVQLHFGAGGACFDPVTGESLTREPPGIWIDLGFPVSPRPLLGNDPWSGERGAIGGAAPPLDPPPPLWFGPGGVGAPPRPTREEDEPVAIDLYGFDDAGMRKPGIATKPADVHTFNPGDGRRPHPLPPVMLPPRPPRPFGGSETVGGFGIRGEGVDLDDVVGVRANSGAAPPAQRGDGGGLGGVVSGLGGKLGGLEGSFGAFRGGAAPPGGGPVWFPPPQWNAPPVVAGAFDPAPPPPGPVLPPILPPPSPFGDPFGNPFGHRFGDPFGDPFGNPFGNPFGDPFGGLGPLLPPLPLPPPVPLPPPGGPPLPIPPDPSLSGSDLIWQGMVLDPTKSNGIRFVGPVLPIR